MNLLKEQIIIDLINRQFDGFLEKTADYKKLYPYDTDIFLIEGSYYFFNSQFNKAEEIFIKSLEAYPYDVDVYFMLSNTYFNTGDYFECIEYAAKAQLYASYFKSEYLFYNDTENEAIINSSFENIDKLIESQSDKETKLYYKAKMKRLNAGLNEKFSIFEDMVRNGRTYVGQYFYHDDEPDRFAGYYSTTDAYYYETKDDKSIMDVKTEFLKTAADGNICVIQTDGPTLVPVLSKQPDTAMLFKDKSHGEYYIGHYMPNHFNYYRISEDTAIRADKPIVVGEPVKLNMDDSKKKLVISLFVDGLAQVVLKEENLENIMPNTYRFFSKGLICNNFFVNADWTYPSIASYNCGQSIMGHKMFNSQMNQSLPKNVTTLFEHMKNGGYYTAMISGDWRASGSCGYYRGLDRCVTKHQWYGMRTEQVMCDAIEHIETFKETNQYLWLTAGDLHDIADEVSLVSSVNAHIDAYDRQFETKSETSVKQRYSVLKREAYVKAVKTIDRWLNILYNYLENNYSDDEYVLTIFGDHGQTYLTKPGEHHLSRSHTNTAFMVRGTDVRGISEEYMSSVDYINIMCRLAGLPAPKDDIEGRLPKTFGGDKENEYTLTETIHPGDPYMASIHSKNYTFYLTTKNRVTHHFKLDKGEYSVMLYDKDNNKIQDENMTDRFTKIVFEHIAPLFNY